MKVIVSVGGRFHAFNLAQQLLKRGYLEKLFTSYPKFAARKFGVSDAYVSSFPPVEILGRGWRALPPFLRRLGNPQFFLTDWFDQWVARRVGRADIYVMWSGSSLRTLRRAKALGAVAVVERGSSHIVFQNDLLREESERWGVPLRLAHPKVIEKELKEYEEADYISVPSSFVRRTFVERGIPASKLIQVPYGVDLSTFQQIPKEDHIFRVVFAGGMMLRKGVHYLLQAFAELHLPRAELLLIGSSNGEMEPFLKKYEGTFRWIGHVPQAELHRYYSQGSVFAILSIEEGMAMVQAQAMACGLPIIATTNTGAEDIVREGKDGFIIPIRDVAALKEKLFYCYEHQDVCRAMGQSAKKHIASGFTWDDYGKRITAEYERIIKNRKQ